MILHSSRNDEYQPRHCGGGQGQRGRSTRSQERRSGGGGLSTSSYYKTSTSPRSPFAPTLGGSDLERVTLHSSRNDEYQGTAAWVMASGVEARGAKDGGPGGGGHEPHGGPAARHGIAVDALCERPARTTALANILISADGDRKRGTTHRGRRRRHEHRQAGDGTKQATLTGGDSRRLV